MPSDTTMTGPEIPKLGEESRSAHLPGRLTADAANFVEATHKTFLAVLETRLSEVLEVPVSTSLITASQTRLADSVNGWDPTWNLLALDLAPLRGQVVMGFPPALLSRILDILFAVPVDPTADPRQTVTEIELQVLREFFDAFVKTMAEVWEWACPLAFNRIAGSNDEIRPLLLKGADDAAVLLRSSVEVGGLSTTFDLLIPAFFVRLTHLESRETAVRESAPETVRQNILDAISTARLRMEAVLTGSSVTMGELVQLRPGQVLMLGSKPGAEFDCQVNGKTQFKGALVSGGTCYRFQIGTLTGGAEGQQ